MEQKLGVLKILTNLPSLVCEIQIVYFLDAVIRM